MEKSIFIVAVVLLGVFASVNSLQCYVCSDCPDGSLKDEYLKSCGAAESTTTAATAVPITTATEDTTTESEMKTTTFSRTTTEELAPVTDPTNSTGLYHGSAPQATRFRRYVLPEIVDLDSGCRCNGENCACDENLEPFRIIPYADDDNITYVCAKLTGKVNGSDWVERDCVVSKINNTDFCEFIFQNFNVTTDCKTCSTDKCNGNSGLALQQSIATILFVFIVASFTK